jgi:hypothetical protein
VLIEDQLSLRGSTDIVGWISSRSYSPELVAVT